MFKKSLANSVDKEQTAPIGGGDALRVNIFYMCINWYVKVVFQMGLNI